MLLRLHMIEVLHLLYGSYMQVISLVGMALELKCIAETNLIRLSKHCIHCYFHFKNFKIVVHK